MGSNREAINVVWDTGSAVYLGETHLCSACAAPTYNFSAENGGSFNYLTGTFTETYGDGTQLNGSWATDTVCVLDDPTTCAADFKWVAITSSTGTALSEDTDGIIGMMESYTEYANALYVPELYAASIISENVFSFLLTDDAGTTGTSYMDFGTPDVSVMTSESDIVWIDSTNVSGWWTNNITGWRWSDDVSSEAGLTSLWGLTDTGSSCIHGPTDAINTWK